MNSGQDSGGDDRPASTDDPSLFDGTVAASRGVTAQLQPWSQRSPVPAAMFNPALIAVIIGAAANQYQTKGGFPMPWPLCFLVPPMVLHSPTREALPKTSTTSLPKWSADHPVLTAGFPPRAQHLAQHVREGLRFGLREGVFDLALEGSALQCDKLPKTTKNSPGDLAPVVRGAGMLGRIFARTGDAATVYAALRVRP